MTGKPELVATQWHLRDSDGWYIGMISKSLDGTYTARYSGEAVEFKTRAAAVRYLLQKHEEQP